MGQAQRAAVDVGRPGKAVRGGQREHARATLVRPPSPLKLEAKVTLLPLVSMLAACPAGMNAMPADTSCVLPAAHCSVPPPKAMLGGLVLKGKAEAAKPSTPPLSCVPPV